jgi:hypothetical protein
MAGPLSARGPLTTKSQGYPGGGNGSNSSGGRGSESRQSLLVAAPLRASVFPGRGRRHLRRFSSPPTLLTFSGRTAKGRHGQAKLGGRVEEWKCALNRERSQLLKRSGTRRFGNRSHIVCAHKKAIATVAAADRGGNRWDASLTYTSLPRMTAWEVMTVVNPKSKRQDRSLVHYAGRSVGSEPEAAQVPKEQHTGSRPPGSRQPDRTWSRHVSRRPEEFPVT